MTRDKEVVRRRAPRFSIRLEGSLQGRSARGVAVVDLSLTGCLVQCDALLDHGAILDFDLKLGDEPFTAKVSVTEASLDGSSPPGAAPRYLAGLHFLALPALEAERLRRFLEEERRRRRSAPEP